jgi:hypothetical protein
MEAVRTLTGLEIWHRDYNLAAKDNLHELPAAEAVFGIFGIVHGQPVNCRYVAQATNLQQAVKELFENPPEGGMKKFMQGAWIQMLQYELMPGSSVAEREKVAAEWALRQKPNIDEDGDYPGYYDY